ncbi:MAG: hypothetical protein ACXWDO_04175 [Bacteroidia bacterium]
MLTAKNDFLKLRIIITCLFLQSACASQPNSNKETTTFKSIVKLIEVDKNYAYCLDDSCFLDCGNKRYLKRHEFLLNENKKVEKVIFFHPDFNTSMSPDEILKDKLLQSNSGFIPQFEILKEDGFIIENGIKFKMLCHDENVIVYHKDKEIYAAIN